MRGTPLLIATLLLTSFLAGCTGGGTGTLAIRVTDQPDDIGDFAVLNVTVDKITITTKDGKTTDHSPSSGTFDLTKLVNGNVTTLFSGSVNAGDYKRLELVVRDATGILASNGSQAPVKAPSGRLFLDQDFSVGEGQTTDFLFDIQVHEKGTGEYQFQPNASGSGPGKTKPTTSPTPTADKK